LDCYVFDTLNTADISNFHMTTLSKSQGPEMVLKVGDPSTTRAWKNSLYTKTRA